MKKFLIIITILSLFIPIIFPDYWLLILTEILIMGLFAISFNLLFGYSGLLSFGHGALFGIGSYVAALMIQHGFHSLLIIILSGMFLTAIISAIIGFLSVKHDEIFFAMLTLAFGMMLYTIAHNWTSLTGGSDGLPIMNLPEINLLFKKFSLFEPKIMYYFVLFVFIISSFILWMIVNSPFGLLLTGIRENQNRLSFAGANVKILRLVSFIISGAFSGLSGVLFCLFSSMAAPDFLHWSFSAKPVIMTIMGGSQIFLGPLCGSAIFFILEQIIKIYTENWMIFLGLLLIPIVLFFPKGIAGTFINFIKNRKKNVK